MHQLGKDSVILMPESPKWRSWLTLRAFKNRPSTTGTYISLSVRYVFVVKHVMLSTLVLFAHDARAVKSSE
jgi:hypothetical protein